jgi:hypothetical protein
LLQLPRQPRQAWETELSVSSQQQFRGLGVALHSQLQSVRANLYLTLYYVRPQLARAARAERRAVRAAPVGYAALLGATYVFAPLLAFVTWRGLAPILTGSAALGVAGALLLVLPPLIHVAQPSERNGATARALRALASLVGYVGLGSAVGAALARTVASLSCAAQGHDECGLSVLGGLLLGAAVGGVLGYCVHGVRQVLSAGVDLSAGADAS